jgi:hypothetical protein
MPIISAIPPMPQYGKAHPLFGSNHFPSTKKSPYASMWKGTSRFVETIPQAQKNPENKYMNERARYKH